MAVGREAQEGWDICILIADSWCHTAETNTMLESNYLPIKKYIKKKKRNPAKSMVTTVIPKYWATISL